MVSFRSDESKINPVICFEVSKLHPKVYKVSTNMLPKHFQNYFIPLLKGCPQKKLFYLVDSPQSIGLVSKERLKKNLTPHNKEKDL